MGTEKTEIFFSTEELAGNLAELLLRQINRLDENKYFHLAVSGGETPRKIFSIIAEDYFDKIRWEKLKIYWVDERCVPPDHPDSNYKMINDVFLTKLNINENNIFRIQGECEPDNEAKRYSKVIQTSVPQKNNYPEFDLILLGVGEDGHTASLFPNQVGLFYSSSPFIVTHHPLSNQTRITVTGNVINNAKKIIFLVTGENKATIVAKIMDSSDDHLLPARLVKPNNGELIWYLDMQAAKLIMPRTDAS